MKELELLGLKTLKLLRDQEVLHLLINNLFYEKILGEILLSPSEKDEIYKGLWSDNNIKNNDEFHIWLETNKLDREEITKKLEINYKLKKLSIEKFSHKAESRFLKRKLDLDVVVYSLIRIKDHFKARELHLSIKENESNFNDIAAKYTEGLEKLTRGIVGPIALSSAHPKIIKVLTSIQPGELYKPIVVDDWNIIIRLESLKPASLDEAMRLQMARELLVEWVDEESKSIMSKLFIKKNN